jgi:hypothetical protein
MLRLVSFGAAIGLLGCATAAVADLQTSVDQYFEPWAGPKGLDTLSHLAACVVERHPASAQKFVRSLGDDVDFRADSRKLMDPKCMKMYFFKNSQTRIDPELYAKLLAEKLLGRSYSSASFPSIIGVAALDQPSLPDVPLETVHKKYQQMFAVDKVLVGLERTSECAARAQPAMVLALAATKPDSAEEAAELSALDKVTTVCGGKLQVNIPVFAKRASLVSNLYRLADAASPVTLREATL